MCSSKRDVSDKKYSSPVEICRLCLVQKNPFVDIFENKTGDGCLLSEKLNESFGIDAFLGDDLPRFVCIDCLRAMKMCGNISYNLWSSLDYLIRISEDNQMPTKSFDIPEDAFDFLLGEMKKEAPSSGDLWNYSDRGEKRSTRENEVCAEECLEGDGSDMEEVLEYCWCPKCNAEFITREDLKKHMKEHDDSPQLHKYSQRNDSFMFTEEYKLLSGDIDLLRSRLCCGNCQKQFKSKGRLVKHILKYDFKCKPKRFETLNILLKNLKQSGGGVASVFNLGTPELDHGVHSKSCKVDKISVGNSFVNVLATEKRFMVRRISDSIDNFLGRSNGNDSKVRRNQYSELSSVSGNEYSEIRLNLSMVASKEENLICEPLDDDSEMKESVLMNVNSSESINERCSSMSFPSIEVKVRDGSNMSEIQDVFICDYCNKMHKCKSLLRDHIVLCHLYPVVHKCSICHMVYPSEKELKTHSDLHLGNSKYICSACNISFTSKRKLISHIIELHDAKNPCVCSVCYCGFLSRPDWGFHRLCHSSFKKFECSKCGKGYISKKAFDGHVKYCQLNITLYECGVCGKEFTLEKTLKMHYLSHDNFRKFPCSQCPKRYKKSSGLYRHVRNTHLKLKPHECGICKKRFAVRQQLLQHYASHSDERPFKCELCGKSYKFKGKWSQHMRHVHITCR